MGTGVNGELGQTALFLAEEATKLEPAYATIQLQHLVAKTVWVKQVWVVHGKRNYGYVTH